MLSKSALSLPVSLLVSLLHVGCCLFPVLSIAAGFASNFDILIRYKPLISGIQLVMLIYLGLSLTRFYTGKSPFHSRLEIWSYHVAFAVAFAGFIIGVFEPFRSEQQVMAQRQFELFKTHRRIELAISGQFNGGRLEEDIKSIRGIKAASVKLNGASVSATFKSDQVSSSQIVNALQQRGYAVKVL
ncbi:heavy-metal-associated domain-containing protein [Dyadobacter crusticola]|uniref:heavy-metal-associated domain-containing protein n=1 Tax=Dyadobacter crusticola TaxID=292407 RepID=UPI0004E18EC0|nr:heavy-metal-associated domain-containing protein [Dyadobacter crusticola]